MSVVLVVNSGSSSLKYQLIEMAQERTLASGLVERIGEASGNVVHRHGEEKTERAVEIVDHDVAFEAMLENFAQHGPSLEEAPPVAVGHRVVQGGRRFFEPTIVDDAVERDIEELIPLAPLHNGANLAGVRAARRVFRSIPHVTVFDTAFHTTMPDSASYYALDHDVATKYRVRKYGAHGTSHKFVSEAAAAHLGRPYDQLRTVVLHIGNGASACAVDGGRSVETSMGMTPLEGLVMGTRTGDIDPAVLFHLHRKAGYSVDQLDELLNRKSGLLGLTGTNDVRDVTERALAGDQRAALGLDVYVHRMRHYLGAYLVALAGADAIAWCGGVGENSVEVRRRVLEGMEWLGVELDEARNAERVEGIHEISTDASRVRVLVVPTDEELEIARQTLQATGIAVG
ncbi:acetate/propionate family kinase [Gulosibacter sp. 10]|uniref:acetate/propionate family kinase n=1 Tax=Gulosibacter sp. 10 TaxID=1255570 RepID=UPI00097F551D|nr:acetate kinase [Gulosibacter sp. 10]SJM69585.1 Acetate kinase [Gulosibacter sp. 10]